MSNIIYGNCINLFYKEDNTYKRIAHSTVFSLKLNLKYTQTKSKDDEDDFYGLRAGNIYWSLQGESLVVENEDVLFDMMTNGVKLRIAYGIIEEGQLTPPQFGYIGYCFITDLELEASTGDKATYKYTLNGCSPLEYGQIVDPSDGDDIVFTPKNTPQLSFTSDIQVEDYKTDGDYDIPDIVNPLNLPVKYIITKIQ